MCDAPSTESETIDGLSLADEQIPDNNLTEGTATDITPRIADDTMIDASVCINNQLDLSAIDTVNNNSLDMSYHGTPNIEQIIQDGFPAPNDEIKLYDEVGNRITATLIKVIDDSMAWHGMTSILETEGLLYFIYNKIISYIN